MLTVLFVLYHAPASPEHFLCSLLCGWSKDRASGDLLTPVGLAFWIMDDGSRQGSGLHLNVYGFDNESVDRLLDVLQGKFNLECTLHGHSAHGGKYRIYVRADSMPRLQELVLPHMVPSMLYKLGL